MSPHYSTLPRSLPSTAAPQESARHGKLDAHTARVHSSGDTIGKLATQCDSLTAKHDIVSLYGTAHQFRTRMRTPVKARLPEYLARNNLNNKYNDGSTTDRKSTKFDDIILPKTRLRGTTNGFNNGRDPPKGRSDSSEFPRHLNSGSQVRIAARRFEITNGKASHYLDRSVSFSSSGVSRPELGGVKSVPTTNAVTSYSTLGRLGNIPKYDASRAFSESLAAFTSRGNNSEYFYSKLSRSRGGSLAHIDNDNLEASDVCSDLIPSLKTAHEGTTFQLGPYHGYHSQQQQQSSVPMRSTDVMTMSLPIGLTSVAALPSNYGAKRTEAVVSTGQGGHSARYNSLPVLRGTGRRPVAKPPPTEVRADFCSCRVVPLIPHTRTGARVVYLFICLYLWLLLISLHPFLLTSKL